jgi:ribonuclease Z
MSYVKNSVLVAVALVSCPAAQEVRGQEIVVTLLGTGSLIPEVDRFGPSVMIQAGSQTLLFDVGPGTHQRLAQTGVPAARIDAVFLTHLHSDHVVGIPGLWLTGWVQSPAEDRGRCSVPVARSQ